jgi:hypothetical protein
MYKLACGLVVALWAGQALAADKPVFGPPESWVNTVAIPKPAASADDAMPIRRLLLVAQAHFGPEGDETYSETATRIQSPQGLAIGNIAISWRPDSDVLTVHRVNIIRGDQVIDVLAKGQTFTILRRETNLEMAMLDGKLTATLQPEGLQVGDILDVAITVKHHDPVMQGRSEEFLTELPGPPVDRLVLREVWPSQKTIRWRITDGLSAPTVSRSGGRTELVIDMVNAQRPNPPKGAPKRFANLAQVQTSEFASWADVSSIMSPLYQKAAVLRADSPIRAEVAKIAAASTDPKVRAAMALHLVQDRTRYLFLGMDEGGYVPAPADETWARKFGDCKGKTALLLALLQQLNIEAEPALVSTTGGDGLDEWLPAVGFFDHVMIRARISGKAYWMDGTRLGDRSLDELEIPPYHWALPIQDSGATLERLAPGPAAVADTLSIHLDATAGLDAPAPAHLEMTLHGDHASVMHMGLASLSAADRDKLWQTFWGKQYGWIEISRAGAVYDEAAGVERLTMDGAAAMSWGLNADAGAREYETDGGHLGYKADFKREPGPHQDAPYAVDYPAYVRATETILLPQGGVGFGIIGDDVEKTVAAISFKRSSHLDANVFTLEASTRSIAPEFPYADAPAAKIALRELADTVVMLRAPQGYHLTEPEFQVRLTRTPTTVLEYLDRGEARLANRDAKAIEDFDQAVQLKPDDATLLDRRCFARARQNKELDKAIEDCDAALDIEPHNASALDSRALVYFRMGRLDKAMADLNAALKISPKQAESLYVRGLVKRRNGDLVGANTDILAAQAVQPRIAEAYAAYGVE